MVLKTLIFRKINNCKPIKFYKKLQVAVTGARLQRVPT